MSRLIIASNRLPFTIEKKENEIVLRRSSGGLVSAVKGYFEKTKDRKQQFEKKIWVGSVDFSPQDFDKIAEQIREDNIEVEPLFIDEELYSGYYNGFSNSTIWPLFHYFPSVVQYEKKCFEAYFEVNRLFAAKLSSIIQKDDVVWIHDYQLMLVPSLLRKDHPDIAIGFFLHIPFPSYEIFRLLPADWKKAIVHGIMGADLVGFHTHDYVQHFIQSVKMLVGIENQFTTLQYKKRLVRADLFPIGIDFEKFSYAWNDAKTIKIREEIGRSFEGKKILFSVDRLDYTKGLMHRLDGYEEFLNKYPEWKEKIVYILDVIPSRDKIAAYSERKSSLEEKISTLNGKFSTLQWQPIIYRYSHLEFEELVALYQSADLALITPLRDGMNLVAKEFVASCHEKKGMLILSELAGAASELGEAVLVNPTDSTEVANAIAKALDMPESEKMYRMTLMKKRLKEYDVVKWVADFIEQLTQVKLDQKKQTLKLLDTKIIEHILDKYQSANKRALLLDYDGTLTPFARIPKEAVPEQVLKRLLSDLCKDEKNEVIIISGRDRRALDEWFGDLPVNLVAEHGSAIKYRGQGWEQQLTAATGWKDQIRSIMQVFMARCVGSFVEEKENTLAWHYRNTQSDLGFIRSRELINTLVQFTNNTWLQVLDGNKVVEVRLAGVDKGTTALKVVNRLNPDFVLSIGDDTTDEDMFKAMEHIAITIKVGSGGTAAHYNLLSQQEVIPFLQQFVTRVAEGVGS